MNINTYGIGTCSVGHSSCTLYISDSVWIIVPLTQKTSQVRGYKTFLGRPVFLFPVNSEFG